MTVRIWGNPRTTSNLNCLFWMYNWKWVNLSKTAGFNINGRQSSSDKKHNISLRLVLFFPFRCCFAGSPQFSLSTVKQTKLFHSISDMFFTFFNEKKLFEKKLFSSNVCEAALSKLQEKAGILAQNSHTSVASDWTYHFSHMWKNIVRDSDWAYHAFHVWKP